MSEQPEPAQDWGILVDHGFYGPPRHHLAKAVRVVKSRAYYADRWDRETFTKAENVVASGLDEATARRAVEQLKSSRALYDEERKASEDRAKARAVKILAEASSAATAA